LIVKILQITYFGAEGMAHMVDHLPSKKILSSKPSLTKYLKKKLKEFT
jgi:hypothetical protein